MPASNEYTFYLSYILFSCLYVRDTWFTGENSQCCIVIVSRYQFSLLQDFARLLSSLLLTGCCFVIMYVCLYLCVLPTRTKPSQWWVTLKRDRSLSVNMVFPVSYVFNCDTPLTSSIVFEEVKMCHDKTFPCEAELFTWQYSYWQGCSFSYRFCVNVTEVGDDTQYINYIYPFHI